MRSKFANGSRLRAIAFRLGPGARFSAARRTSRPPPSDVVDGALARHRNRLAEGLRPLIARPDLVELVRDVREHDTLGAGALGVIAGLGRRHVAAIAGALGPRERG